MIFELFLGRIKEIPNSLFAFLASKNVEGLLRSVGSKVDFWTLYHSNNSLKRSKNADFTGVVRLVTLYSSLKHKKMTYIFHGNKL